jgi:acetylornithine deacetylase/succinyl-diaminopimelate desuccinylase-like protein
MPRSWVPAALFAICLSSLLAGCGSGDSKPPTALPSKAEFVKQADALCKQTQEAVLGRVQAHVRKYPGSLNIHPEIARDKLILLLARPEIQKEAHRLAALPAPKGDEEKIQAIVAALEAGIRKAEEDPLSTVAGTYRKASQLATAYGIKCYEVV